MNFNNHDNYEPNDTSGTAHPITSGTPYNANVHPNDDSTDYYTFNAAAPGPLMAQVTFEHWAGQCNLRLYDAAVTELASSSGPGGYNRIDYLLPAAGVYYLHITSGGNEYELVATY